MPLPDNYQQATTTHSGGGGAKARHRVVQYDSARIAVKCVKEKVENARGRYCELKQRGIGSAAYFAGTTKWGGQPLRVTVTHTGTGYPSSRRRGREAG